MNNSISFKEALKRGAVQYNPVLVQLVGLCPVIAASTTFMQAVILSAAMCAELLIISVIANTLMKGLPRWIRMPAYLLIGLAIVCPVLYYFETYSLSGISLGLKIYLPLTAINSVVAVHCEQVAVKSSMKLTVFDAVASGIGGTVIFLFVGAVREILGYSTFAGVGLNLPVTLKGMTLPFGCLILLGFLAAGLKKIPVRTSVGTQEEPAAEEKEEPLIEVADESFFGTAPEPVHMQNVQEPTVTEFVDDIFGLAETDFEEFLKTIGIDINSEEGQTK